MKKIGILTFHNAVNYGACLQAYALKEVLKDKKVDVDIINYNCEAIYDFYYKVFTKDDSIKTKIKKVLTYGVQAKRNKVFKDFLNTKLIDSTKQKMYNKNNIKESVLIYDKFIVGSDQVWSPFCTGNDMTYFLDFVEQSSKKFSYAACLGIAKDDFFKQTEVKKLLEDFNMISVREASAKQRLEKILNQKKIETIIDPTFLLTQEKWNEILPVFYNKEKYILVYSLSMPKEVINFANELSRKTGYKLIYISLDNLFYIKKIKNTKNCSPIEFVNYVKNAEYVITNSFHGTAFSIIYNKEFFTIKNSNPNHDNSRLYNLLENLDIKDRLVLEYKDTLLNKNIKYNSINKKLDEIREQSLEYIDRIIKN